MAKVPVLVGPREYQLSEQAARRLSEWLRQGFDLEDVSGSTTEREVAQQAHYLADVFEEDAAATAPIPEPVEPGQRGMRALDTVMRDYLVAGDDGLQNLYNAVQRYYGAPEFHNWKKFVERRNRRPD
jgi:hypothetical protein